MIVKRNFKQWWSTIRPKSPKRTTVLSPQTIKSLQSTSARKEFKTIYYWQLTSQSVLLWLNQDMFGWFFLWRQTCKFARIYEQYLKTINAVEVMLSQFDLLSSVMITLPRVALCNQTEDAHIRDLIKCIIRVCCRKTLRVRYCSCFAQKYISWLCIRKYERWYRTPILVYS